MYRTASIEYNKHHRNWLWYAEILRKGPFMTGVKAGLPIGLGYLPVSFTYGVMAVSGGLPIWTAILVSLTNLTSAGQFAGTNLIFAGAGYFELTLTVLVINLRYTLMSLSLSQRLNPNMNTMQRMIFSYGITDETFVVASVNKGRLDFPYLMGLISMPALGWVAGTALGGCVTGLLTPQLQSAMGIALYAMFIAIIVPPARESRPIVIIILCAVAVNLILMYVPLFSFVSSGFRIIIATISASAMGAKLFPKHDDERKDV